MTSFSSSAPSRRAGGLAKSLGASAEYGNVQGAVFNIVTRQGSNTLKGDGTFYFSNPQSVLAVSQNYGLPVFMVVLDNSGWGAVKEATLRVYPAGEAKAG